MALALGLIALVGIGVYIVNQFRETQEIAALSVKLDQAGASDPSGWKAAAGTARTLSLTFRSEPISFRPLWITMSRSSRIFRVRAGMSPDIRLQLKPIQEIAALSVQTEPAGASILLDGKPPQ